MCGGVGGGRYRLSKIEAGVCDKDGYKYYTGTMETGEMRDQPAFETTVLCETFPFPVTTLSDEAFINDHPS